MFAHNWSAKLEYLYYDLGAAGRNGAPITFICGTFSARNARGHRAWPAGSAARYAPIRRRSDRLDSAASHDCISPGSRWSTLAAPPQSGESHLIHSIQVPFGRTHLDGELFTTMEPNLPTSVFLQALRVCERVASGWCARLLLKFLSSGELGSVPRGLTCLIQQTTLATARHRAPICLRRVRTSTDI